MISAFALSILLQTRLAVQPTWAGPDLFLPAETEVISVAMRMMSVCPPATCEPIFVGRSLVTIAAYIEAAQKKTAIKIPLSRFRYHPEATNQNQIDSIAQHLGLTDPSKMAELRTLTPSEEELLFKHFDEFIPQDLVRGKSVMVFDYAQNGASLFSITRYLERYLNSRYGFKGVRAVPVVSGNATERVLRVGQIYGIKLPSSSVLRLTENIHYNMSRERYEVWAPYSGFDFLRDHSPSYDTGNYDRLVQHFKSIVERTPWLSQVHDTLKQGIKKTKDLSTWVCGLVLSSN